MPKLSKGELREISKNGSISSLERYTGSLGSLSREELTFVLQNLLYYLNQAWYWQFHMAKNGRLEEFVEMCREIIRHGASVNRTVYNGEELHPFLWVCTSNEPELIRLFLDNGADVKGVGDSNRGRTPLHFVALEFRASDDTKEAIQMLKDAGVDINAQDEEGQTMLDIAAEPNMEQIGSKETIEVLQVMGATANRARRTVDHILRGKIGRCL